MAIVTQTDPSGAPAPLHVHAHDHDHTHLAPTTWTPGFSLLRLSVVQRLGGVAVLIALIWSGVFWAMHP